MGKTEEDWNGLKLGFLKTVQLTVFQSWSLLLATSRIMLRRHICLSRISDFFIYRLCTYSTLFLCISLPLFCTITTWNFQKLLNYTFYEGNVARFLVHFFFTAADFHLALVAGCISHFVTAATKFSCCSFKKKMSSLFFMSSSRSLSSFFSLNFAGLPPTFSFSRSFSCSTFQICGHDN